MHHLKPALYGIAVFTPVAAAAQATQAQAAATFSELVTQLPADSTIVVTDQLGRRITGRFIGIERDALTIRTSQAVSFRQADVLQVQRKIPDSVLNGGLIGFAIGMAGPLIVCTTRSDSSETAGCAIGSVGFGGLPGFAIGALLDRARGRLITVFRRNP